MRIEGTSENDASESGWGLECSLHDWQRLSTQLSFIYDSTVRPELANSRFSRKPGEYSAWLIRNGTATMEADGQTVTARAGDWLVCTARELRQELSSDVHLFSLRLQQSWHGDAELVVGPSLLVFPSDRYPELLRAAERLRDQVQALDWSKDHPTYAYAWRTRLNYLRYAQYQRDVWEWNRVLAEALQSEGFGLQLPLGVDVNLSHALHMLDTWDFRKPFSEREVAHAGKRSYPQLSRACQRTYGVTPFGYWEQRRIERGINMLQAQGRQVKEVAYELGFRQLSHFSAWFKRHTGQSPKTFRQQPTRE